MRHLRSPWIPVLVSCIAATGCVADEPPATARADDALSAADVHLALERALLVAETARSAQASRDGFVAAVVARLTPDAAYLAPGHPIVPGRAAIAALLAAEDPAHGGRATFDPRRVTVSADGLIGHSFGWNVFTAVAADGTTTTTFGKYSTVWEHHLDGWRIRVHVENATGFTPSPAPADFPLLDDEPAVIRLADPRRTAREIADTDRAFAADSVARGSGPAFPAFADDDAVEVAGPIIYGVDQIAANHAGDPPPSELIANWAPSDAGASLTGDLGWTIGNATFTAADGASFSKYLTVWERQVDGRWRWIADMGNGRPAPTP
jgi:ketosteroid isomerase-like protein